MRIGVDAQVLGGHESGVELWIRHVLRTLSEIDGDHEYVVYTHEEAMPIEHREGWSVEFRVGRTRSRLGRILWEQLCLPELLRRDGIDVLHAPAYVMPLRARVPTVLTVHDVIALKFPRLASRANALHYRLMLPRSLTRAAVVVASSETTKRDILDIVPMPAEKIRVVHPGIDPVYLRPPTPAQLDAARGRYRLPDRFILFVGNLEPKKNLPTLFRAVALMRAQGRWGSTLVVVGAKSWKRGAALAGLEQLDAGRDVRFLGYVPREQMPSIYALADLFVFPSLYEGFGFPPLEAMACGTPVVCSDTPAVAEVAGDAGALVPASDAPALADAIALAIADETQRATLIARGRERATRFAWANAAREVLAAYAAAGG